MKSTAYRMKVDMIVERENHFNTKDFENPDFFPTYLVFRKPASSEAKDE